MARDLAGALGLVLTSAMLVWTVIATRNSIVDPASRTQRDLATAFGLVAASALVTAAGLLATVPFTIALASITDDTGIGTEVQAGIAQSGSVVLFVAAFPLAVTVVLLGRVGTGADRSPRWIATTSWVVAALLLLGCSVGLLLPFALWSIAFGLTWKPADRGPSGPAFAGVG